MSNTLRSTRNSQIRSPSQSAAILQILPSFVVHYRRLVFSCLWRLWYSVWGLSRVMNSVFQSSNYTPGGAPCNPQDTSAGLSDEMGISHSFTLTAISGVQTSFNMEYLPEAFAQSLLVYCSTQVMVLLEVFDELSEPPRDIRWCWRQRLCAAEPRDVSLSWLFMCDTGKLSKRGTLNWVGRIK